MIISSFNQIIISLKRNGLAGLQSLRLPLLFSLNKYYWKETDWVGYNAIECTTLSDWPHPLELRAACCMVWSRTNRRCSPGSWCVRCEDSCQASGSLRTPSWWFCAGRPGHRMWQCWRWRSRRHDHPVPCTYAQITVAENQEKDYDYSKKDG